jgi:hypothetical protein
LTIIEQDGLYFCRTYNSSLSQYRLRFSFVSLACIVRSFFVSVRLRFVRVIG